MKKDANSIQDIDEILEKYVLIKNITILGVFVIFVVTCLLTFLLPFKLSTDNLISLEQTLFVILTAVIFVFNESIIGFETINKVSNTLGDLKKSSIEQEVKSVMGESQAPFYGEFLGKIKKRISEFKEDTNIFKSKSYKLYMIFALLGFLALFVILIKSDAVFVRLSLSCPYIDESLVGKVKCFLVDLFVKLQFISILIWVISAKQAEKQKLDLLNYLDGEKIVEKFRKYMDAKANINIKMKLQELQEEV